MSIAIQFDTLDYAKKLETTGMPAAQAEQHSRILADVLSKSVAFPGDLKTLERNVDNKLVNLENRLTSRIDQLEHKIDAVKAELEHKIDAVKAELEHKIDALRIALTGDMKLLKWMMATLIAFNIAISVKLFLH